MFSCTRTKTVPTSLLLSSRISTNLAGNQPGIKQVEVKRTAVPQTQSDNYLIRKISFYVSKRETKHPNNVTRAYNPLEGLSTCSDWVVAKFALL